MTIVLTPVEARILGALIEKQITTPEYYPLSLNALINACNQKSNRDPLMHVDEPSAREALSELQEKGMAGLGTTPDSRVAKYEHRLQEVFNFSRQETAVLCELLLRGPQTPGELRTRADRMQHFDDLSVVQNTLQKLMQREPSLVKVLPRQTGRKEARYAQLLTREPGANGAEPEEGHFRAQAIGPGDDNRLSDLQNAVVELRKELADLRSQMAEFRKQFE